MWQELKQKKRIKMKRVLNSCFIKLPYIVGFEKDIFRYQNELSIEEYLQVVFSGCKERLEYVSFTFEIKAPLITFLAFQDVHLGTLKRLHEQDHPIAYLPSQFYKKAGLMYNLMDPKACNVNNTKLYNFYSAAINFYNNLLKDGMCKEQAQLVLPQGMLINFLWEINLKDLITYIEEHHSDSPEIFGYCSTFVLYLEEHFPIITKWLRMNRWQNLSL